VISCMGFLDLSACERRLLDVSLQESIAIKNYRPCEAS
jgi:hypothetical protein